MIEPLLVALVGVVVITVVGVWLDDHTKWYGYCHGWVKIDGLPHYYK
jgi:hypothetical protein